MSLVRRFRLRELRHTLPALAAPPALANPFVPRKNPATHRWAPPRYSLRRQADLVKQARAEGSLHLLPPGPKLALAELAAARRTATTPAAVDWLGDVPERAPPGADVGNRLYAAKKQMFKGHKWERVIRRRRKYQRILMRDMPRRIWRWRQKRARRKPDPLSAPRLNAKDAQKLPF